MADKKTDSGRQPATKPTQPKRIGPYPLSEDDLLRKVLQGGPPPEKQRTKKGPHGGAVSTPKPKPQKGN